MARIFETKQAITQLVWEIFRRSLRLTGFFWDQAIQWCQSYFTSTDPRCHGNEIWDKVGYNSACTSDIAEILGPAIESCQTNSTMTGRRCHGNRIWHKIGYNSISLYKKGKGQTLDIAPQVDTGHHRSAQVHGAHKAASHVPALYLPSCSWYSFTDPERRYLRDPSIYRSFRGWVIEQYQSWHHSNKKA